MNHAAYLTNPSVAPGTPEKRSILPGWMNPRVLGYVWAGLVVYGTLVPFNFALEESFRESPNLANWLVELASAPRWFQFETGDVSSLGTPNWVNDLILNVALYAPLGFLLRLDGTRRSDNRARQMLYVVGTILLLSWALECTQHLMKGRVGSLNDIVTNCVGGLIGALPAVAICNVSRGVVFRVYCRVSYVLYHTKEFLIRQRRRPVLMFAVVAVNIVLVTYWYATAAPAGEAGDEALLNWLPFSQQFKRSYDVAALQIGRSLLVYCLLSMILSLQFMRAKQRKGLGWIIVAVALLAVAREVIEYRAGGQRADITEPIISIMAVGFILTTVFLLVHAVRCSCRRKKQMPIEFDRRRIPHSYDA